VLSTDTFIYVSAAVVSSVAAFFAFRVRSSPGSLWLSLMLVASAVWSAAEVFDYSVVTLPGHILAAQFSYLGSTTVPVLYLLFSLEYTGRWTAPTRWVDALFALPAFSILAAFTNGLHHLVWPGFVVTPGQPNVIAFLHGPVYWVIAIYSFAVALLGTALLVDMTLRTRGLYRAQSLALVIAAVFPLGTEVAYNFAPRLLHGLDPAIAFPITGIILTIAISRLSLLDLVPVPREVLVEEMTDGVVVVDQETRVTQVNPAAVRLLGLADMPAPGARLEELFANWSRKGGDAARAVYTERAATLESTSGTHLGVERTRIGGGHPRHDQDLFILRDITVHVQAKRAMQGAHTALRTRMAQIETLQEELLEQATRDPLTQLHNRRYLAEELEQELGRASRQGYPVSVLMFDVDYFKNVNDTYGHAVGDDTLKKIATELTEGTRRGDVTSRYGGDEFVVVLSNSTTDSAVARAERWRLRLRDVMSGACDERVRPTVSVGVATYPIHGTTSDAIVSAADRAVYSSKGDGRDRVSVAEAPSPDDAERVERD
jgi:diguanylate cyclase (GGDEF)-like protein